MQRSIQPCKKFYYIISGTAAIGQFDENWVTWFASKTPNDTKMPMMPKDALEAWAVQSHFLIQDISDLHVMAAIWKTWGLKFEGAPCKTPWRSWFRSCKSITNYPKHIPKPSKSAFKFDLNLILKGVLPHQNSKTGTFQNSWKICYFSNISVTYISIGEINLGNNNP